MNLQWIYFFLSVIFVKFKTLEAKEVKFNKDDLKTNARSINQRYYQPLNPQVYNSYGLYKRPYLKRHLYRLLKKRKVFYGLPSFEDLTRLDHSLELKSKHGNRERFSDDYIDISWLARKAGIPVVDDKKPVIHHIKPEERKALITRNGEQVFKMLDEISRKMLPYQKRSNLDKSSSDEKSDSESESKISENARTPALKSKARTRYKAKRFQVINNNSGETISNDDNDEADDVINISFKSSSEYDSDKTSQDNTPVKSDGETSDDYVYVQSPTRHMKTNDLELRRRLKHFLPKRVHWDKKDFQDLRNYWINGPRGRYPWHYKTPY